MMIGGVLTYKYLGTRGVCGNTIGANGAGEFAFVIDGTTDEAWRWAKAHLAKFDRPGNRLANVCLVLAEEGCDSQTITIVRAGMPPLLPDNAGNKPPQVGLD